MVSLDQFERVWHSESYVLTTSVSNLPVVRETAHHEHILPIERGSSLGQSIRHGALGQYVYRMADAGSCYRGVSSRAIGPLNNICGESSRRAQSHRRRSRLALS